MESRFKNRRITYYSALIPKGTGLEIIANDKNIEILNFIEVRALCLIKVNPSPNLLYNTVLSINSEHSGWWKLEVFYHQLYGRHDHCISLLNKFLATLKMARKQPVRLIHLKTIYGFFDVPFAIKRFLENGSIRIRSKLELDESQNNRSTYTNRSRSSLSTDSVDQPLKVDVWISDNWRMTLEKILKCSIFITRQILNPKYYDSLDKDYQELNLKTLIIKEVLSAIEEEILKTL